MKRLICILLLLATTASTADLPALAPPDILIGARAARARLSFDSLPVRAGEMMGMLGVHYDLQPCACREGVFAGFGGFGGLTGDRGGFFTGGLSLGYAHGFGHRLAVEGGAFVGAGGGASAFPGGGTMLRAHLTLLGRWEHLSLRLGAARTEFPNTTTEHGGDTHLTLGVGVPLLHMSAAPIRRLGNRPAPPGDRVTVRGATTRPTAGLYLPSGGSIDLRDEAMEDAVPVLGVAVERDAGRRAFVALEAGAAGGAGYDGYMEVLAGPGLHGAVGDTRLAWSLRLLVGMAGGGKVDTGGGLIIQPGAGLDIPLRDGLSLRPDLAWTWAPDGRFDAAALRIGLTRSIREPRLGDAEDSLVLTGDDYAPERTDLALINKAYLPDDSALRKSGLGYDDSIQQLGLRFEKPVATSLALSGGALAAWSGGVGAYAEGLFGVRWNVLGDTFLRYDIGVGGGGGMDVGDGVINQVVIGWRLDLAPRVSIEMEAGRMRSIRGGVFEADVLQVGVVYRVWGVRGRE